jgi:hypothetical protein
MGKKSRSGIQDGHPNYISESLETIFWVQNTSILCCGAGIRNIFNPGSGIRDGKIRIGDKHPGSATLVRVLDNVPDLAKSVTSASRIESTGTVSENKVNLAALYL